MSAKPIAILGCGGHARVVHELALACDRKVIGYFDFQKNHESTLTYLGTDAEISRFSPEEIEFALGVGSIKASPLRASVFEKFKKQNYYFATLVHPLAMVSPSVVMEEGVQIMLGALVQAGVCIGTNTILNTGCCVEHDVRISASTHISPRAVLLGEVCVGAGSHIGANATVLQGLKIGTGCTIAAGAVVIENVMDGSTVIGVPAKKRS